MARAVAVGAQYFDEIRDENCFYIDKTNFIKEWWENKAKVTLITRPRRFGKTLTMSTIDYFFSIKHKDQAALFDGLSIWKDEKYRNLQGTYPVIFLSFAGIKKDSCQKACREIGKLIIREYQRHIYLTESAALSQSEKDNYFLILSAGLHEEDIGSSINYLSEYLTRYYGKKVIILLDEYDTPMQEAYSSGYWNEMASFMSGLFNLTFKSNPFLERGLLTGITRAGKESIFSDLNNLKVITTTSEEYASSFGFTECEVFHALEEFNLQTQMPKVKEWYDGFNFGSCSSIYNPWSIINFLAERKFKDYWANTSSNTLISNIIQKNSVNIKIVMEDLLLGKPFHTFIDEEIIFKQLDRKENAVWSLLLASGYLKIIDSTLNKDGKLMYTLSLTNLEVMHTFRDLFSDWFSDGQFTLDTFSNALLSGNIREMNEYLNAIMIETLSFYDTGKAFSKSKNHENFYHGFVLGLLVSLKDRFIITSNRESGYGRYDVILKSKNNTDDSFILEFKVLNPDSEKNLQDTVNAALKQIVEQKYAADLETAGVPRSRIKIYGFAFSGKEVIIDGGLLNRFH